MSEGNSKQVPGEAPPSTPEALREGVREGILAALERDVEISISRIGWWLALAGALGVAAAMGSLVLFSGDTLTSDHGWHLALCAAAWAGILVDCFFVVLVRIDGHRLPLGHATTLALIGFALAAFLGAICPDPQYFAWWTATAAGSASHRLGGPSWSAFCLGACTAGMVALGASLLVSARSGASPSVPIAALLLFLLLWPAVILQSAGVGFATFVGWSFGLAGGTYLGVLAGVHVDRLVRRAVG